MYLVVVDVDVFVPVCARLLVQQAQGMGDLVDHSADLREGGGDWRAIIQMEMIPNEKKLSQKLKEIYSGTVI